MILTEVSDRLNGFTSHLTSEKRKCFLQSLEEKSLEDWAVYFQTLDQRKQVSSQSHQRWSCPHCFVKKELDISLRRQGERNFSKGEVAFLTVAGGLGTRLNFNGPKGLFPVTPLKRKPLFQVFAEKLIALQRHYQQPFHWLIMTSEDTHDATVAAFRQNKWYDLNYVHFFKQGTVPAFDEEKRPLMQKNGHVCYFPDGHGGVFKALNKSGLLKNLEEWGIKTISYFQVDNPLVVLGDALFLGLHLAENSDFSTKVVSKRNPQERVGVFVQENDSLRLVEYSEMSDDLVQKRDASNQLVFRYGNTAIHLLSLDFIKRAVEVNLPYHAIQKQMNVWDPNCQVETKKNVYKLESFIFDALPYARNPLLLEVVRGDEFSPVKNATGDDTPETCLRDQTYCWLRWLKSKCNFDEKKLAEQCVRLNNRLLEVSPLFAEDIHEFSAKWDCRPHKYENLEGLYLEDDNGSAYRTFTKGF